MKITDSVLNQLPKVELHCHLDGSLRIETIIDLAKKNKINLPYTNKKDLQKALPIGKKRVTLEEYIARFDITLSVMQTPSALNRIAYELIEDVSKENVRYIEVRYSPILHTKNGMTLEEAIISVRNGLEKGNKDFGVKSGIIICGIRHISPQASLKLADLCVKFKNKGVIGFDLAGAEENFPAKDHREAFYMILNNIINATIHAGEAFGPSSIHQAIHHCGAHRIGHGTRLKEDLDLMEYVNNHRITMEVCLTSNWHTFSVKSLKQHPFKFYYDKGIRVTLNTDNRLISNTTLTKEFSLARDLFNFTLHDFREITIIAMKASFLPHLDRKVMIKDIAQEFETSFGVMPEFIDKK